MMRVMRVLGGAIGCALVATTGASAQTTAGASRGYELTVAGTWTGPTSFGTSDASLLTPGGGSLTLFSSTNDLRPGYGFELHVTRPLTTRFAVEGSGTLARATLRSRISSDFEDAPDVELTETLTRFTVEGSARWTLSTRGRISYFLRGGAGWMRELAGDGSLAEDGAVINAGAGFTYWARDGARRLGFRVDGRVQMRRHGITLGADKLRFSPVLSGGLLIGF